MGTVFNLWDFATRTLDQIIRFFYKLYDQETVQAQLWESFRGFAVNDEKGPLSLTVNEEEIALLFDQLIDLVGAIQTLQNTKMEHCLFCRSADTLSPGGT
ncbi:hypothetical protein [Mucilaginibacter sp. NFX135]|uniref:hypothetical protein n=1 Tax=Mucilaginibacter sp. NFX135 TaxID=3402687 RepID=UPI003AFB5829